MELNIVWNYSPKSFAVTGKDTKSYRESLMRIGGKFNERLTCGPGWIFSLKHKDAVIGLVNKSVQIGIKDYDRVRLDEITGISPNKKTASEKSKSKVRSNDSWLQKFPEDKDLFVRSLIDLYGFRDDQQLNSFIDNFIYERTLMEVESDICKRKNCINRHYATVIRDAKGEVRFIAEVIFPVYKSDQCINCGQTGHFYKNCSKELLCGRYTKKVVGIEPGLSCELYRRFGANRFMVCKVIGLPETKNYDDQNMNPSKYRPIDFFETGISFAGRKFDIFYCNSKNQSDVTIDANSHRIDMTCVMYAPEPNSNLPQSVSALRDWVGDCTGIAPMKLCERMSLVLSPTHKCIPVKGRDIFVVEDVVSEISKKVLSDGCGLISSSLVQSIPVIKCGVAREDRGDRKLPAVVQVRLRCPQGLFKASKLYIHLNLLSIV